ncbi:patatin-like phospholipase family protein [Litoribacter populi]|uniref:patatin-like phospholipase family protein n=1 Tax=Litoribacter populi TaxID=2598460 RepID=UPI00117FD405|nr:patatin-like phospholipase family protein [Litoribacter populi]
MDQKTVSLVLSSGGARGLAHIGVIEVLEENGFEISSIAGCSMGALIAGVYAKGNLPEFKEWICNLDRIDVFSLMDFTLSTSGFIKGEKVFQVIQTLLGDCLIEDLPIPFSCNAVDILNGSEMVFKSGSLFSAIRASAAIPTVMQPAIIDNISYVDGGILNPMPVELIKHFPTDICIASDVNGPLQCLISHKFAEKEGSNLVTMPAWVKEYKAKVSRYLPEKKIQKTKSISFLDLMNLTIDTMQDRISDYILENHPVDVHIKISRKQCGTFEFYRAKEITEIGREIALDSLREKNLI